jgi:hypothetical protein
MPTTHRAPRHALRRPATRSKEATWVIDLTTAEAYLKMPATTLPAKRSPRSAWLIGVAIVVWGYDLIAVVRHLH